MDRRRIQSTSEFARTLSVMQDARRRLEEIKNYITSKYPAVGHKIIKRISTQDLNNPSFHWYGAKSDFVYHDIHPDIIKAFLSTKKVKKFVLPASRDARERALRKNPNREDRVMSYDHIRKYHDALLFGAQERGTCMSNLYSIEMKKFLESYKKEVAAQKKLGKVEEFDSDAFTFPLVRTLCSWFLKSGDVISWLFLLMQWNCMARSINIDCIGFSNLKRGSDSIIVKYDETKSDKTGETCSNKHIYGNPADPVVCVFLALGLYSAIEHVSLATRNSLFLKAGATLGSAAKNFCNRLASVIKKYSDIVASHIRCDRANVHGIRKGGSRHATSETTCPPSLVSVALRGEWSMGKVFDIYFKFGSSGDEYLGRILAGLNPNNASFACLPPYFTGSITNPHIERAMKGMFGDILENHPSTRSILSLCLASIVYHSEFLKEIIRNNRGHPLETIFIFQDESLLQELKMLVSTQESEMMKPTGIPPHVNQMVVIKEMHNSLHSVIEKFETQTLTIVNAVKDAIHENDVQSGVVNLTTLEVNLY